MLCGSAAVWFVLLGGYFNAVPADPRPAYLYGDRIAELEAKSGLSDKERLALGKHHMSLGKIYASIARTAASLTLQQAEYYAQNRVIDWGAEYFGALSALELGKVDAAIKLCTSGVQRPTTPPPLRGLIRILGKVAKARQSGSDLGWGSFNPTTRWDSLEVLYRLVESKAKLPPGIHSFDADGSEESDVILKPLIDRAELAVCLLECNVEEVRAHLRQIESEGLPFWSVSSTASSAPAVFSDPALAGLVARAHYYVAEHDFAPVTGSDDEKLSDTATTKWIKTCFLLHNVTRADSLLNQASDSPDLNPYRGWVAWQRGNDVRAWEHWTHCLDSDIYRVKLELLSVWRTLPELREHAYPLIGELLTGLGNSKERAELRRTKKGKNRIYRTYKGVGAWYSESQVYDTASLYYEESRVTNTEVGPDLYPSDFCAEYFSSRAFSNRVDFRQGGYQDWSDFSKYFLSSKAVVHPLEQVISLETNKRRLE